MRIQDLEKVNLPPVPAMGVPRVVVVISPVEHLDFLENQLMRSQSVENRMLLLIGARDHVFQEQFISRAMFQIIQTRFQRMNRD
jgi:hypothetical protein